MSSPSVLRQIARRARWTMRKRTVGVRDGLHNFRRGRGERLILVLRQREHLIDYNDHFLAWLRRRYPADAATFVLRRVEGLAGVPWGRIALVVPWVQDPVREHHPGV